MEILGTCDQLYTGTDEDDFVIGDVHNASDGSTFEGNDTINGGGGNDLIFGDAFSVGGGSQTHGSDSLSGGDGDDRIFGDAKDVFNGSTTYGDDLLEGGPGDDTLYGDSEYVHFGGAAYGNDTLIGGPGNDLLQGDGRVIFEGTATSGGSDTFVFNFTADTRIETTTVTYETDITTWVETTITETFDAYLAAHNLTRAGLTQAQFSNNYGDWLNSLVARYHDQGLGQDLNGDGKISVGINQNSSSGLPTIEGLSQAQVDAFFDDATSIAIKTGKTSQTRYFSNEFSLTSGEYVTTTVTNEVTTRNVVTDAVHSGDGHDVILDFQHGVDVLKLTGVRPADFAAFFTVQIGVDGDDDGLADDTVISLNNQEWSVTLANVNNFDLGDIRFAPAPESTPPAEEV